MRESDSDGRVDRVRLDVYAVRDYQRTALCALERFVQELSEERDECSLFFALEHLYLAAYYLLLQSIAGTDKQGVFERDRQGSATEKVLSFPAALRMARTGRFAVHKINPRWELLSEEHAQLIIDLHNEFRNRFEHPDPATWVIEESALTSYFIASLVLIRRLALESYSMWWTEPSGSSTLKTRINNALGRSDELVTQMGGREDD